jgi:hypothetical protein
MKNREKAADRAARRAAARRSKFVIWMAGAAVLALIVYAVTQMSSVAYDEHDLRGVNFTVLNEEQKQTALEEANRARCTCGCGMNLARCVATDMTCPIREANLTRIRLMVEQARR